MIGIISLFIELLFSNIISKNTYILPLFTLVSLLLIKRNNKYYLYLFILGFLYDLFFTEIIFLHSIIFLLLGVFIKLFKRNIILVITTITLYQILIFIIYSLLNIININILELLYIMSHYYILNIIYYYILCIILKRNHNIKW